MNWTSAVLNTTSPRTMQPEGTSAGLFRIQTNIRQPNRGAFYETLEQYSSRLATLIKDKFWKTGKLLTDQRRPGRCDNNAI